MVRCSFINPGAAAMAPRRCAIPQAISRIGPQDVFLGRIADSDFYIGAAQFEYWKHTQLIIDVVPGRGAGFSLEAPEGVRFLTRSRLFTEEESNELEAAGLRAGCLIRRSISEERIPGLVAHILPNRMRLVRGSARNSVRSRKPSSG